MLNKMSKTNTPKLYNPASIFLVIYFCIKTIIDYIEYVNSFTSAPFYVWVLANALCLIILEAAVFFVEKSKQNKK
jgi:hypothetical protein